MNTATDLISRYATDIAYVAEEKPATTVDDFIDQMETVATRLNGAGIHGSEDLDTAAAYLADTEASTDDTERTVLLKYAAKYLANADDMIDEYRGMVGE